MPPALGRIIYFSNSGREEAGSAQPPPVRRLGRSAEARALGSETAGRLRGSGPGTYRRAVVMLAVSLKWRLGVVRRRPKGTEQRLLWGAEGATGGGSLSTRGPPVSWLAFVWVLEVSLWHSSWGLESGSLLPAPVSCSFLCILLWGPISLCSGYLPLSPPQLSALCLVPWGSLPRPGPPPCPDGYPYVSPVISVLFTHTCSLPPSPSLFRVPFSVVQCLHFSELLVPTPHGMCPQRAFLSSLFRQGTVL